MGAGRKPGAGLAGEGPDTAAKKAEQEAKRAAEKESINKINRERTAWYKSMMGDEVKLGNWIRVDEDLDDEGKQLSVEQLEERNRAAIVSGDMVEGVNRPESGVYKDESSKFSFVYDAEANSIKTLGMATSQSYFEAIDFLAQKAGCKTIVIDWPSPDKVNEKTLRLLMEMCAEKGLEVEFGSNVKEYLTSHRALGSRLKFISDVGGPEVGRGNLAHAEFSRSLYDVFNEARKANNRAVREFNGLYEDESALKEVGEKLDALEDSDKLFKGEAEPTELDVTTAKDNYKEDLMSINDDKFAEKFNSDTEKLEQRVKQLEGVQAKKDALVEKKGVFTQRIALLEKQLGQLGILNRKDKKRIKSEIALMKRNLRLIDKTLANIAKMEPKFAREMQEVVARRDVLKEVAEARADALKSPESEIEPGATADASSVPPPPPPPPPAKEVEGLGNTLSEGLEKQRQQATGESSEKADIPPAPPPPPPAEQVQGADNALRQGADRQRQAATAKPSPVDDTTNPAIERINALNERVAELGKRMNVALKGPEQSASNRGPS